MNLKFKHGYLDTEHFKLFLLIACEYNQMRGLTNLLKHDTKKKK